MPIGSAQIRAVSELDAPYSEDQKIKRPVAGQNADFFRLHLRKLVALQSMKIKQRRADREKRAPRP